MKNNIMMVVIIFGAALAATFNINAGGLDLPVDDTFNYQGELIDNGTPANGEYDFTVRAESNVNGPVGLTSEHTVDVENGLFLLKNVDLGVNRFSEATELFLRVSVRKTADAGAYTALNPTQLITSVPYASQLISGGAANGQVLTFDGSSWQADDLPAAGTPSPWTLSGTAVTYNGGRVGIGIGADPHIYALQVKATDQFPASFDGADNNTVVFKESGNTRGLIGSGNNIGAEDFSIATPVASNGKIHLAPQVDPVLTVTPTGLVGIGSDNPLATLEVKNTEDSSIVAMFNGGDASYVAFSENGQIRGLLGSIGATNGAADFSVRSALGDLHLTSGLLSTPTITLKLNGETQIKGNTVQPVDKNGMMKLMITVNNCGEAGVAIEKSYNAIDGGAITATNDAGGVGSCFVDLTNATDISNRFNLTNVNGGVLAAGKTASCEFSDVTDGRLACTVFNASGNQAAGSFDLLVY